MRWLAHRGGALDFRDFARAQPGRAVSGRGRAGRRSRRRCWARSRRCRTRCRSTSSRACCAAARTEVVDVRRRRRRCRCRRSAEIVLEGHIPSPDGSQRAGGLREIDGYLQRSKARSATTPAITTSRSAFRCSTIDRITHAPRPDLPLDLHRQAARRAGGAGRGAERSVRAAPAAAVSRDRRLLPAARRLLATASRCVSMQEAVSRATRSA